MSDVLFNVPPVMGGEMAALADAIERRQLSGDGYYTERCEDWLAARLNAHEVALTQSCTHALEMAALLLGLGEGDEVIMPSYTFSSTANAVALRGAKSVFADIEPGTMNIDAEKIEELITPRTKAIFVVHYAGRPADMDRINEIAKRHSIEVVEDAAQSLGSTYKGEPAGSHSCLSAISFHATKNIISGEGGALVINDPQYAARAAILREKGTNRSAFMEGLVDKYTWVDIGSSFLPSELVAAYLWCQLDAVDQVTADRVESWNAYYQAMQPTVSKYGVRLPDPVGNEVTLNGHIFHMLLATKEQRPAFLQGMKKRGVHCTFHYVPLHSAPAGIKFGNATVGCPVTEDCASRLIRLPLHYNMGAQAVGRVVEAAFDTLEDTAV